MGWTTPRTWSLGELVTEAMMNEQVKENELFLYGAYNLIETVTLGATAQTLASFTNIPATYRNLRLVFQGESHTAVDAGRYIRVQFNGDAGNNYSFQEARDGAEQQALAAAGMAVGIINGILMGFPTHGVIDISNYAGAAFFKQINTIGGHMLAGDIVRWESTGSWGNAAAINRIDIFSEHAGTQFLTGSSAWLYGY